MLGGLFGVISENTFARDLFFGIDYHSHLGTEVGGLAFLDGDIHSISEDISNGQFKTYIQKHYERIKGRLGVGVISDIKEEQPIKFESKIGTFALCTIGLIRNSEKLSAELIERGVTLKKSKEKEGKKILNQTEIIGELICSGENLVDGIERMYKKIEGSISLLLLSKDDRSIYAVGDTFPLVIGVKKNNWVIASETSAFPNLGYRLFKFLDYREIVSIRENGPKTRAITTDAKKFCPFLHIYSGFPTSDYYGINAEIVRERCGGFLAENDGVEADLVLGIADSGFPHAVGYVKRKTELTKEKIEEYIEKFQQRKMSADELTRKTKEIFALNVPLRRSLVKYTPGWGRSYIPSTQKERELIAEYKQIPNPQLIEDKKIILVDDSIRRGTQLKDLLRDKVWPYRPKEIHGRIASPPQLYPCIFDLSTKRKDLATCKALREIQESKQVSEYRSPNSMKKEEMVEEMRKMIGCTTLKFITLENMIKAVIEAPNNRGLKRKDLCLYCWTGNF
jgi:amidophosphoribosyltransferase